MSEITKIIEEYAGGTMRLEESLDKMRQIPNEEPEVDPNDNPWVTEAVDHEGGCGEIYIACTVFDLTYNDYELFSKALTSNPIYAGRLDQKPKPKAKFDETTVPSLIELLGDPEDGEETDGEREVVSELAKDPAEGTDDE